MTRLSYIILLITSVVWNDCFSTNFYTQSGGTGQYGNNSHWVGAPAGRPGNNTGYSNYAGPGNDTIFINHPLYVNSDFTFGGQYVVVLIGSGGSLSVNTTKSLTLNSSTLIVDGGALTITNAFVTSNPSPITVKNNATIDITDNFLINNTVLTIEDGSTVTVGNTFSTSNTTGSVINLDGTLNVGGNATQIAGTWNVNSTGELNVTGNLTNNTSGTTFNVSGDINVTGNTSFHSGNFNFSSGGTLTSNGAGDVLIGNAIINNNGEISFPNSTSITNYGGSSFDCDGSSGTGSVGFGTGSYCASACTGGGAARCVDSGVPLPIELNYFNVDIENDQFVFTWETLTETNNDFFTVEYSFDLNGFESLLEEEGEGTSFSPINYERTAEVFPFENLIYFRLKQTDFDGQFSYSSIEALSNSALKKAGLSIYPNPTKGKTLLKLDELNKTPLNVFVLSPSTLHVVDTFQIDNGESILDFTGYENGVYFLKVENMPTWFKLVVQ